MKQNFESSMVMYSYNPHHSGGWVILKGIFNEIISNIWNTRKWEMYVVSECCRRGRRRAWSNKIKRVWFSQLYSLLILYPNFFFLTCSFLGLSCLFLPIISLNGQNWDPPTSALTGLLYCPPCSSPFSFSSVRVTGLLARHVAQQHVWYTCGG